MFTGIDEVDWTALHHAYGTAGDVPGWLRALASEEPGEREAALDALYGAVHPEGKVYGATLAAVPFLLEVAAREGVGDRSGVLELLVSIGSEAGSGPEDGSGGVSGSGGVDGPGAGAVRSGAEVFVALTLDADPAVRRAAVAGVVRFVDDASRVLPLLSRRLLFERDDDALIAVAEAVGLFVRRHPAHAGEAIALLTTHLPSPNPPVLRLAVLGQLAAHAPDRLPPDLAALTARLLQERSSHPPRAGEWPGAEQTLTGRLRRLRPSDEQGARLLRTLHTALADDVPTRTALLRSQLRLPSPTDRCNAVLLSAGLIREWRGDHSGLVSLIGEQLAGEEGRLRDVAVSVLGELYGVGAPAADRLHALVAGRPEGWVERWRPGGGAGVGRGPTRTSDSATGWSEPSGHPEPSGTGDPAGPAQASPPGGPTVPGREVPGADGSTVPGRAGPVGPRVSSGGGFGGAVVLGGPLLALARCGDGRAVAALGEVLGEGELPRHAASVVPCLGAAAAPLAPALRWHLAVVPLGRPESGEAVRALLGAVGGLRDGDAVPQVLRVLESGVAGLAEAAFGALEAMGGAAREALPVVRGALDGVHQGAAAAALWAIEPDVSFVLPVLLAEAEAAHDDPGHRALTAGRLARLGPAAHPALPALRRLLTDSADSWERVSAGCAITAITGEIEREVGTVLRSAWHARPLTRVRIATTLTNLAPEVTAPLLDLPATELTHRRRHLGRAHGQGIVLDETLLSLCRELTARA